MGTMLAFPPHRNDGEGDRPKDGGGVVAPPRIYPSTVLWTVPLPPLRAGRKALEPSHAA
jgi:hypothetical protein